MPRNWYVLDQKEKYLPLNRTVEQAMEIDIVYVKFVSVRQEKAWSFHRPHIITTTLYF